MKFKIFSSQIPLQSNRRLKRIPFILSLFCEKSGFAVLEGILTLSEVYYLVDWNFDLLLFRKWS